MALRIFFLRHGQTDLSRDHMFCGSGSDPGITASGLTMARQFAAFYRSKRFAAIYCSPQLRAKQTLAPFLEVSKLAATDEPALREIDYGAWEGRSVPDVMAFDEEAYIAWSANPGSIAPGGGESALALMQRTLPFIERVRTVHADGDILCISHKATIRVLLCSLLGIDVGLFRSRLDCPVCSVSVIEFTPAGPMLRALADRMHLSEEMRNVPST